MLTFNLCFFLKYEVSEVHRKPHSASYQTKLREKNMDHDTLFIYILFKYNLMLTLKISTRYAAQKKMDALNKWLIHSTPCHHRDPPNMGVLLKTFRHIAVIPSPTQQRRPWPSVLYLSFFYDMPEQLAATKPNLERKIWIMIDFSSTSCFNPFVCCTLTIPLNGI